MFLLLYFHSRLYQFSSAFSPFKNCPLVFCFSSEFAVAAFAFFLRFFLFGKLRLPPPFSYFRSFSLGFCMFVRFLRFVCGFVKICWFWFVYACIFVGFWLEGFGFFSFDLCVLGCVYVCICVYFGRFWVWSLILVWNVLETVCACWVFRGFELNPGMTSMPGLGSFRIWLF